MNKADFIGLYAPLAISATANYNLLPSVALSMAAIESGWQTNSLSNDYNNFFSIKAYSNPDNLPVTYADDDKAGEPFRVYADAAHSFNDYVDFLYNQNQRYIAAGLDKATTPEQQLSAIMAAGYATSTYKDLALSIIDSNHLTDYDDAKATGTPAAIVTADHKKKTMFAAVALLVIFALVIILICMI